jgi:hypothetical protein
MHVLRCRKVWRSGLARAGIYLLREVLRRLATRRCGSIHISFRRRLRMPSPAWRFSSNNKPAFGPVCYRNWYGKHDDRKKGRLAPPLIGSIPQED